MPITFEFISVKSYHGTQSTGTVKISGADTTALHGKHCLLCEDIIDSGTVTVALRYKPVIAVCIKRSYSHNKAYAEAVPVPIAHLVLTCYRAPPF